MKLSRRFWGAAAAAGLLLALAACGEADQNKASSLYSSAPSRKEDSLHTSSQPPESLESSVKEISMTDSLGNRVSLPPNPKTVCLYGSYSQAWLLAGGELAGVTQDALEERQLDIGQASIVGTVKEPSAESILALDPDLVVLSADIAAQQEMLDVLESAGLACLSYRVDTFEDYAFMMEQFCLATGDSQAYQTAVTQVAQEIEAAKATGAQGAAKAGQAPRVLLIRAFSTGIKAKTEDELAGVILRELGCQNIASQHPSMLEDLSLEEVIAADPDFIFVTTMGDEAKALGYLDSVIAGNPAWSGLSAVKENRYTVLPKDLFHYKPNNRWGESYRYLGKILYPEEAWDPWD